MAKVSKQIQKWTAKKNTKKLVKTLNTNDISILLEALNALGEIGDAGALHSIQGLLRSPESEVRMAALESLGKIGSGKSKVPIQNYLDNETDAELIEKAKLALSRIKDNESELDEESAV